jgi:transposase
MLVKVPLVFISFKRKKGYLLIKLKYGEINLSKISLCFNIFNIVQVVSLLNLEIKLVLENRKRTPLITYNTYRKEKKEKEKQNPFNGINWEYDGEDDTLTCPNGQKLTFRYWSHRTDRNGFTREFKIYECEDCSGCPFRSQCTKAKEGHHRRIQYNQKWKQQKEYIKQKLSEKETGEIYGKRKVDAEPIFGFLKANLRFTRLSVKGKDKVKNELGFAFMAVTLKKITARKS